MASVVICFRVYFKCKLILLLLLLLVVSTFREYNNNYILTIVHVCSTSNYIIIIAIIAINIIFLEQKYAILYRLESLAVDILGTTNSNFYCCVPRHFLTKLWILFYIWL